MTKSSKRIPIAVLKIILGALIDSNEDVYLSTLPIEEEMYQELSILLDLHIKENVFRMWAKNELEGV